ncbi:MAG: hypothetical protein SW019_10080 [Actinomycetota bacterium]|nr:hypothetical protein [Actinomycetota bacterium]
MERSPAPSSVGYSHYVGRVGALAVALGLGAAVASMPAVALADTTKSPGSTQSSSSSRDDSANSAGTSSGSDAESSDPDAEAETDTETDTESDTESADDPIEDDEEESDEDETDLDAELDLTDDAGIDPDEVAEPAAEQDRAPADDAEVEDEIDLLDPAETVDDAGEASTTATAPQDKGDATPAPADDVDEAEAEAGAPTQVTTAVPQAPAPQGVVARVASWLGWSSGGDTAPPALAPLTWATAAFARREIGVPLLGVDPLPAIPVAAATVGSCGLDGVCLALEEFQSDITNALSTLFAAADPALEDVADLFGAAGFTLISAGMLSDFETVPGTLQDLATNQDVLASISTLVAGNSALAGLPPALQSTIGDAAAYLVEQSLGNQVVAEALVPVFEAIPFPTDALDVAEYLADLVEDDFSFQQALVDLIGTSVQDELGSFFGDPDVQQALGSATADAITVLTGATTPSWATPASTPAVATYLGELVATAVLGDNNSGVASVVTGSVAGLLSAIGDDLADAAGSAVATFLSQSGVNGALATEVLNSILAGLGGSPLSGGGPLAPAVGVALSGAADSLLSNAAVVQGVGSAIGDLVAGLIEDAAVREWAGTEVAAAVTAALGDIPIAATVGLAVGAAVQELMATPGLGSELGALIASLPSELFDHDGVAEALSEAVDQIAAAVISGDDPTAAVASALAALRDDAAIETALKATAAAVLADLDSTVLGSAAVQQALGNMVTALVVNLASDTAVQAFIAEEFGSPVGTALVAALADPAVGDALAEALGSSVTDFLSDAGFRAALADVADRLADAVLDGSDVTAVLVSAVAELENNAAVQAAVASVVPEVLKPLLGNAEFRDAVGDIAETLVTDYLEESVLDNVPLDGAAGQFVRGTLESLLASPAVTNLLSDVAADVLDGTPLEEVTGVVLRAVLTQPNLQIAVGMALGQGIGALFGDNIVGTVVGAVVGFNASIAVVVTAGVAQVVNWLSGGALLSGFSAAAPPAALSDGAYRDAPMYVTVLVPGATGQAAV